MHNLAPCHSHLLLDREVRGHGDADNGHDRTRQQNTPCSASAVAHNKGPPRWGYRGRGQETTAAAPPLIKQKNILCGPEATKAKGDQRIGLARQKYPPGGHSLRR